MFDSTPFDRLLYRDDVPEKGSTLWRKFEENPRLLGEKVGETHDSICSVISLAFVLGNLNLADCILKLGGNSFVVNADPFYLGKMDLNIADQFNSAGVSFYCALTVWQLYSQQNKFSELATLATTQELNIKKTYYELFYWEDENNTRCYPCNRESDALDQRNFMSAQAEWFMQIAYAVFQLEEDLKNSLQLADTPWSKFSDLFFTSSNSNKIQKIYAQLSDYYLHIAYMEITSRNAFVYFIRKANDYHMLSLHDGIITPNQLTELANEIKLDPSGLWLKTLKKHDAPLQDCGIVTKDYAMNAADAWRKAFNYAHERILSEGIPSSLRFMETDSTRTSSTERNSHSSVELREEKKSDSQFDNVGLHRRCKGSNESTVTANPLLKINGVGVN